MNEKKPATLVNLRKLRTDRHISQDALKAHLYSRGYDISRQAIDKWEAGQRIPKIDSIIALADYFGVSVDYLLGRDSLPVSPDDLFYAANALGLSVEAAENIVKATGNHGSQTGDIISDILTCPLLSDTAEALYYSKAGIIRHARLMDVGSPPRLRNQCRDMADMYLLRAVRATEILLREILGYNSIQGQEVEHEG